VALVVVADRHDAVVNNEDRVALTDRDRVRGCLLGGAVGDALGAGIEFLTLEEIRRLHGPRGVTGFVPAYGRLGAITDDTQMTLWTVEGLIRASVRASLKGICHPPSVVWYAYLRWLSTQAVPMPEMDFQPMDGWLITQGVLRAARAPGNACLSGLRTGVMGTRERPANPGSKGCGAVMRSAPFGLLPDPHEQVWDMAVECAVLTHGHPSGYLAAGALAWMVRGLMDGQTVASAAMSALTRLKREGDGEEVGNALEEAIDAADALPTSPDVVESLGQGWVAEEALAIATYCALGAANPREGLLLAVNHSGDSDSTGAICGNLLGAAYGDMALPLDLVADVEARGLILEMADDFVMEFAHSDQLHGEYGPETTWTDRYPGW